MAAPVALLTPHSAGSVAEFSTSIFLFVSEYSKPLSFCLVTEVKLPVSMHKTLRHSPSQVYLQLLSRRLSQSVRPDGLLSCMPYFKSLLDRDCHASPGHPNLSLLERLGSRHTDSEALAALVAHSTPSSAVQQLLGNN